MVCNFHISKAASFAVCVIILCASVLSTALTNQLVNTNAVSIAINSGGSVYTVAGKTLSILHSNLTLERSLLLTKKETTANTILLSCDERTLIICFNDGTCNIYPIHTLPYLDLNHDDALDASVPGEMIAVSVGGAANRFYVGSSGYSVDKLNRIIMLRAFDFFSRELPRLRSSDTFIITNSKFSSRSFHHAFQSGSYAYFVVTDVSADLSSSKLLRVCDSTNDNTFSAVIELELQCGNIKNSTLTVISKMAHNKSVQSVLMGFSDTKSHTVCSFDISIIDSAMESVYQECVQGIPQRPLSWTENVNINCSSFTEVSYVNVVIHKFCLYELYYVNTIT